jgi:hypothetical protein
MSDTPSPELSGDPDEWDAAAYSDEPTVHLPTSPAGPPAWPPGRHTEIRRPARPVWPPPYRPRHAGRPHWPWQWLRARWRARWRGRLW